ncbi:uncharacterized protein AMSG_11966 [Thecamonas trahens ATCC 50062]|uniref:Uncharacterized protein n=1 Tax=Thecamonas trahens ATCC 50062 TaxID=461836 RepID=A0A0L0DCW2_THETB|nr:hypothetical protein AMSG_11966 [Thecamonas trahens ATCC 50062]KNC50169.1 hypothetical protein AMSG_11966 [Thecamonas trahens ATCC 50062]|eukprot:XP_013757123.1 hypothetical protein AMSG_11966 [Thecamonas trahens ATCC 50062]
MGASGFVSIVSSFAAIVLLVAALGFIPWIHMTLVFGATESSRSHVGLLSVTVPHNALFPFQVQVTLRDYVEFFQSARDSLDTNQPSLQPLVDYGGLAFAGLIASALFSGLAIVGAVFVLVVGNQAGKDTVSKATRAGVVVSLLAMLFSLGSALVWMLVAVNDISYDWAAGPWLVIGASIIQFVAFVALSSAIRGVRTGNYSPLLSLQFGSASPSRRSSGALSEDYYALR